MDEILSFTPRLKGELKAYLAAKQASVKAGSWEADFLERLQPYAASGKLLRGNLVLYGYEMFAHDEPTPAVIQAALALELTHSALLIHDDIMDDDNLRRGRPAMHYQYQQLARKQKLRDPQQFGINMALSGGDITIFLALDLLSSIKDPAARIVQQLFIDQLLKTCAGQMQDAYSEASTVVPSKQEIYSIMKNKTASYTIALPLSVGAALASEPLATRKQLQALGASIGTIFQIRDDELGVMGSSAVTGKPVGADIREGKKTLLLYFLARESKGENRRRLMECFGNAELSAGDITFVQQQVTALHIHSFLDAEIDKLKAKAHDQIFELAVARRRKIELEQLVAFCAKRHS